MNDNTDNLEIFDWTEAFPQLLDADGNFEGFDVVMGNPPYISFQSDILQKEEIRYYSEMYQDVYKIYDTFALFIEKAFTLLKPDGLLSYICPSVLLMNRSFYKLRKTMVEKGDIINIVNCGDGVFDHAVVPTITFAFSKEIKENAVKIYEIIDKKAVYTTSIDYEVFKKEAERGFNLLLSPQRRQILEKFADLPLLSDFLEIRETIKTGNDKKFILPRKRKNSLPVITGKDMNRYYINQNRYINFDEKSLSRPTKLSYYTQEKLFIRRVGHDICAAYDAEHLLSTHVLYVGVKSRDEVDLKYLLALLNSKLLSWIYNIRFPKKAIYFPKLELEICVPCRL
ncbi:MAG: Eco57I restriction-modification methylase domain-containing protein [Bernardetiaceae bacterium]|nr:Eco57I restriction-modification methylase domain-containing protein [Bernardetiaceae bacterium]